MSSTTRGTELRAIGGDLYAAIDSVKVPSYVLDPSGIIRWQNEASRRIVGDVRGRQYTSVVAPEDLHRARDRFTRNVIGRQPVKDGDLTVLDTNGNRVKVEISSFPLIEGGHFIGMFGQVVDVEEHEEHPPHPVLTPRQAEILRLLERGRSTTQIAQELYLSPETVRNHIRRMFRALGVHTRLEAVALARHGYAAQPS